MRGFFRKLTETLNIPVEEMENGDMRVCPDPDSDMGRLFGTASPVHLTFGKNVSDGDAIQVMPGCRLLEDIERLLAAKGGVRHVRLPAKHPVKPEDLRKGHDIIRGETSSVSTSRDWETTVRCFVKIVMIGEEAVEEIIGIEIPPRGPMRLASGPGLIPGPTPLEVEPVGRPMLRLKTFHSTLQQAMRTAETIALERAEDLRTASVARLYTSLERMRAYYRQVREETPEEDAEGRIALEQEYHHRREEEIERAAVRVRLELVAVETIAEPVLRLRWTIAGPSGPVDVRTIYNMHEGRICEPVRCRVCERPVVRFGPAGDGRIVCPDCLHSCGVCGADILRSPAENARRCSACGREICGDCAASCMVCGEQLCGDHVLRCEEGCAICRTCARTCPDCPPGTLWCPDHAARGCVNEIVCRIHAVYCAGCRESRPASRMVSCGVCGRTVCPGCREQCGICGGHFCLNHIQNGRCESCQTRENHGS